ncbi:erythromycin esterase family protein [Oculatella sp. FACHB-28]|uniref:erythromycin esterase family protein n=1 Tax=Oculatella sp. FACHB-28 TaxID=2692845 RepID=UPI0016826F9B|nr:erythromycin esterase family protein [Oculatella sp. FACHB-28]MBD2059740.1 erythromycin esterase family protein [Oculatella sp. FACHB-28]
MSEAIAPLINSIQQLAHPLTGAEQDYNSLLELIGEARFVLIGEASHGTHEFYQQRADLTKQLIQEKGFVAVAVEADFPNADRVNRFVRGIGEDATAIDALDDFQDFPLWMWRNTDVLNFVDWLRQYNDTLPEYGAKVGFYGLDLYSMYASMEAVLKYLEQVDPEAAKQARHRYSCFDQAGEDSQSYGYATTFGLTTPCEDEAINQLMELQRHKGEYAQRDGRVAEDDFFYAEQNARLVKNAEAYYRSVFQDRESSWNVRDRHMAETLDHLTAHLNRQGKQPKIVVWAHNSHLGDARATDMKKAGEWNLGQLVRERYGQEAVLIGFTTYSGTVAAASHWGDPVEVKQVRPALPGSYEAVFHQVELPQFWLNLRQDNSAITGLQKARLERAIGVVYSPRTERRSHYFKAQLPAQFDAVIHIDHTHAVEPLDHLGQPEATEVPETFPSGL